MGLFMQLRAAALLVGAMALVSACSLGSATTPSANPNTSPPATPLFGWTYEGSVRSNAVDPRTVVLPDGSYRQIYGTWQGWQPTAGGPGARGLSPYAATAVSKDGIHWTEEGALSVGYLVPVRLPDGRYRGYGFTKSTNVAEPLLSVPSAFISDDAKNWRPDTSGALRMPEPNPNSCGPFYGVSDVVVLPDQTFRMYYNCSAGQANPACNPAQGVCLEAYVIDSATSKDGLDWTKDLGVRIDPRNGPETPRDHSGNVTGPGDAKHPRVVALSDGSLKAFYWSSNRGIWSATSVDGLIWKTRQPEGIFGGDPDVIALSGGRLRLFVNGFLGLPQDFDGKTVGENQRIVSYVYGPVRYRVSIDSGLCVAGGCTVNIEGSGPTVTLGAIGYSVEGDALHASNPRVFDLVTDPASPVKVEFVPPSSSPPFRARAAITLRSQVGTTVVLVANDGVTEELTPLTN